MILLESNSIKRFSSMTAMAIDYTPHHLIPIQSSTLFSLKAMCSQTENLQELSLQLTQVLKQNNLENSSLKGNTIILIPSGFFTSETASLLMQKIYGSSPLLTCLIKEKEFSLVSHFLSHPDIGNFINKQDDKGQVLLHYAIHLKTYLICQKILNITTTNPDIANKIGITPLHLSVERNTTQITHLLLQHNANVLLQCNQGYTAGMIGKKLRSHKINGLYTQNFSKELFYRTILAHLFDIGGCSSYTPFQPIKLEGFKFPYWAHLMHKVTKLHPKNNSLSSITDTLNFTTHIHYTDPKKTCSRLQSGKPVIIPVGYYGHSIMMLIYPKYTNEQISHYRLGIANRGDFSKNPIEFYSFKAESLSVAIIQNILDLQTVDRASYLETIQKTVWEPLKRFQSQEDAALEKQCSLKNQTVGNCSWISTVTATWAFFALENEGDPYCKEKADSSYEYLLEGTQSHVVQKYYSKHQNKLLGNQPTDEKIILPIYKEYSVRGEKEIQSQCLSLLNKQNTKYIQPKRKPRRNLIDNKNYDYHPYRRLKTKRTQRPSQLQGLPQN